tara:strand:- start:114 stop:938 length:825 start_codon:yes stop_codon:yes gene_type:complete
MKFKNILTESMIDTLPMSKLYKAILKTFHKLGDDVDDKSFIEISDKFAVDLHLIFQLYLTYTKYSDILFSEEGMVIVPTYDTSKYDGLTNRVLTEYIYKNYNGKEIYNVDGITGTIEFMEDLETSIGEEMFAQLDFFMPLTGEYHNEEDGYTTKEVSVYGQIYLNRDIGDNGKYGYTFINHSHESFGEWAKKILKNKYVDEVDNGYVKDTALPPLKNYSTEEVKRFCDQWVNITKRILIKQVPLLMRYKEHIEDDSIFESYNKKKNIKNGIKIR